MKKALWIVYSFPVLFTISCSNDNPSQPEVFVPQIQNRWHEENKEGHTFQLNNDSEGANKGIITGDEEYPDSNIFFGDAPLEGFFINHDVYFNVHRTWGVVKYSGTAVNAKRLEMNSFMGKLVLVHD